MTILRYFAASSVAAFAVCLTTPQWALADDPRERWEERRERWEERRERWAERREERREELEDYWDNHWKWYDNDYRRYYTRRNYVPYNYRSYEAQPYGYNPMYSRHPYRTPYGRAYDRRHESGGSIGIGPFRLQWR